jgi:hypothetical protein
MHARDFRRDEPVCTHAVGSVQVGESVADWRNLIQGLCEDHLVSQGLVTDWATHHRPSTTEADEILPHVHMAITTRVYASHPTDLGRIRQTWLRTAIYPAAYAIAA